MNFANTNVFKKLQTMYCRKIQHLMWHLQIDSAILQSKSDSKSVNKRTMLAKLDGRELEAIDSAWLDPSTSASLDSSGTGKSFGPFPDYG